MKDAINSDMRRGVVHEQRSVDLRMGEPSRCNERLHIMWGNSGNWNILVPGGKENNSDSQSSGERNGNSPNRTWFGVVGLRHGIETDSRMALKGQPQKVQVLYAKSVFKPSSILSTARHVEPCRNLPGPSGKAKYSLKTDSEPVPWGKGEKNRGNGVK